jgi:hypothetical protein
LDAKFVRCYPELFLGGGSYENPQEYQVGGICFRRPTVSRAYDEHNYEELFPCEERMARESPKCSLFMFDCYQLNQARTWPGPEHYLCYEAQAGPLIFTSRHPPTTAAAFPSVCSLSVYHFCNQIPDYHRFHHHCHHILLPHNPELAHYRRH